MKLVTRDINHNKDSLRSPSWSVSAVLVAPKKEPIREDPITKSKEKMSNIQTREASPNSRGAHCIYYDTPMTWVKTKTKYRKLDSRWCLSSSKELAGARLTAIPSSKNGALSRLQNYVFDLRFIKQTAT